MSVKCFSGRTVAEALGQVRDHLGTDALIIETRSVREPGALGRKVGYEVIAASAPERGTADDQRVRHGGRDWRRELLDRCPAGTAAATPGDGNPDGTALSQELKAIRRQLTRLFAGEGPPATHLGDERLAALDEAGLPGEVIAELDDALAAAGERLAPERSGEFLARYLSGRLPCTGGIDWQDCRRLLVVGPTGVGKTTTIAKLAGELVLKRRRNAALVTLDTYRIGAPEQLQAYADLLGIPCLVANGPERLAEILDRLLGYDNVLVDTAGRNPADAARLEELRTCCRDVPGLTVMLTLAATSGAAEFAAGVERFSLLPIEYAAVTKLDENREPGRLYGSLRRHRLPLAYATFGQEVPDDLGVFDPERLARRITDPRSAPLETA